VRPLKKLRCGLIVLVRNGRDGSRVARIDRTDPLVVQKWNGDAWGALRELPERDVLGLPDKDDDRAIAARKATTT
jgi:hypothetical protein